MLTLSELAHCLGGVWHGNAKHTISGLSSLFRATPRDLVFFDNPSLFFALHLTKAGAVLLKSEYVESCPVNSIVVSNPLEAMIKAAEVLTNPQNTGIRGIHPSAQVHPSVRLGKNISVGANSVIHENAQLDDNVTIGSNTTIHPSVCIGKSSQIDSGVVIHSGSLIGQAVIIDSGCIIGAVPFNYNKEHGIWQHGLTIGGVVICQETRIGANTVIDRGSVGDTYVGERVCIDSLVLIAHDVYIGNNTAIAGCAVIGARTQIGSDCIIGGASCLAANIHLANDIVITGMSTVIKSITRSGIYSSGTIVHDHQRWRRNAARFKRLDDYIMKLKTIEKKFNNNN
ncbi:UDP-3-O-(3-hydroxymyristoyl) glucosamine N-acyltransferase [Legionella norrlandica]|uniref:UDP-3-O-(3-hydroxymyristoyl) glucosamine N-acyltransferase n=1 Tax=Legionella norrlandica TaxID=1498499 RepID=A0A0A2SRA7_9GAMM|nr:UDP-3-O-(3-hydroxymyristoyl)glucosamine N-acyltransferase [Legionella norrlandica]KGP62256.1 UDP-3-O-(3-hydroxymyristoyl) glucosamine N-acyltransferase [Legionella norrlandica]